MPAALQTSEYTDCGWEKYTVDSGLPPPPKIGDDEVLVESGGKEIFLLGRVGYCFHVVVVRLDGGQ